MKSTDNSTNLRTVLVTLMLKAHPEMIDELHSSIPTAAKAAKLNLGEMEQQIELLAHGVRRVQLEAEKCATCEPESGPALRTTHILSRLEAACEHGDDASTAQEDICGIAGTSESEVGDERSFGLQLEAFARTATPQIDKLRSDLRSTTRIYNELLQYLGEVSPAGALSKQSPATPTPTKTTPPPPPPPPPPPCVSRGSASKTPRSSARRLTLPPATPAQLFGAIDSFSVGLCAAAVELKRKNAIQATKQRSENARRVRLRHMQHKQQKHQDRNPCDERTRLMDQIRTCRQD